MGDSKPRRALGLGLDALLPVSPRGGYEERSIFSCGIERVVPQKGQPRRHFDIKRLTELADSIREHGLLEPILVRRMPGQTERFEIIAGERRWRAAQKAGLKEVLVVVKDVSPSSAFELALVENLQREDLNSIELAESYERLIAEHGYTQEALSSRLHKDRTTIANAIRLLKLPQTVRNRVVSGELTEGHARALLGVEVPSTIEALAEKILRAKLSVRATEALVRATKQKVGARAKTKESATASSRDLEVRLGRALGTKVFVRDRGNKGEIVVPYADLDALDRLIEKLL